MRHFIAIRATVERSLRVGARRHSKQVSKHVSKHVSMHGGTLPPARREADMTDDIRRAGPVQPVVWRQDAQQRDARQRDGRRGRHPAFADPPAPPPPQTEDGSSTGPAPAPLGAGPVALDWSAGLVREVDALSDHGRAAHARAAGAYERLSVGDGAAMPEGISPLGIPAAEMTPAVRRALSRLSGEIDRLHHEMEARGLEADALADGRERADHLPMLGARALERAVQVRLAAWASGAPAPAVLFFYLANFEEIRQRHGLAAAEAAYHHMAAALAAACGDDEVAGAPGGAGAVVLTPFSGQVDAVWARLRSLGREAGAPITWTHEEVRLSLLAGVHLPRKGERAADALWQAERAARRLV
jgi:GGDEF domain-containing protein